MTRVTTLLAAVAVAAAGAVIPTVAAHADPAGIAVQTLHFATTVGPDGSRLCDIEGDLYTPAGVSADDPAPAVLTTHGFGQTKDAQRPTAEFLAGRGYVVLAYSGVGFGGSGCKVGLDSPDPDGQAAQDLVSFLGGANGIAFRDAAHTQPVPGLDYVVKDRVAHDGRALANDPRVGMVGGSYGGAIQLAAAATDPRIDAIVPMITWNDLSYSLAPNSTSAVSGVSSAVPGATKTTWATMFMAAGLTAPGEAGYRADPTKLLGCPNFSDQVCTALATSMTQGFPDPQTVQFLRSASAASYVDRIHVPVLLIQGEEDTLFNLNEAQATFDALQRRGSDVKMIWQKAGHSTGGDTNLLSRAFAKPDPATQYTTARYLDWFDHYLKDSAVGTGPTFAYFQDWAAGSGDDPVRYATASSTAVGEPRSFPLSDGRQLAGGRDTIRPGTQTFGTPAGGVVAGSTPSNIKVDPGPRPENQPPGSYVDWTSDPQAAPMDVVGAPTLTVQVSTPTPVTGDLDAVVVFAKLYDVGPDGSATQINGQVAPVRIVDPSKPVQVTLPAIVHRFDTGHRVRLVLAGGDSSFRGGLVPHQVTVATGDPAQQLVLPVVAG
ncbi:CocE/NonD family hydrolase [Rhodococcus spelaei]|uniref:CocE/NonD family hydrolase n=1 Tax=Rhodococcus spelaei TaxID=2546320 RepID=A0A541B8P6_9NOCA|nr:CocE/NonD family hydrolase [Rhodococcus spelaei]TQF68687.1 CocE/NonD family hydrolase [Rhodococcus spelaei]